MQIPLSLLRPKVNEMLRPVISRHRVSINAINNGSIESAVSDLTHSSRFVGHVVFESPENFPVFATIDRLHSKIDL